MVSKKSLKVSNLMVSLLNLNMYLLAGNMFLSNFEQGLIHKGVIVFCLTARVKKFIQNIYTDTGGAREAAVHISSTKYCSFS